MRIDLNETNINIKLSGTKDQKEKIAKELDTHLDLFSDSTQDILIGIIIQLLKREP